MVRSRKRAVGPVVVQRLESGCRVWDHGGVAWFWWEDGALRWQDRDGSKLQTFCSCLRIAVGYSLGWIERFYRSVPLACAAEDNLKQAEASEQAP